MRHVTTTSEVVALPLPLGAKETAIRARIREAIELVIAEELEEMLGPVPRIVPNRGQRGGAWRCGIR
jgi:hypothetical protein